jgi:hypothetical protein
MISKSLSTSEKFAALHDVAGKLAEFCQSLYPLILAHADDFGRLPGDVFTVKHLILPTSPRKLVEFDAALKHLHNTGLITWYQGGDGKWCIAVRGWFAHQQLKGHDRDGRKSSFPDPPENPSNFEDSAQSRPKSPKSALTKENLTKGNLTEPIRSSDEPTTAGVDEDLATEHVTNAAAGAFLKRFCDLYSKHRYGAKYFVKRQKDVPLVRQLLLLYDADRLAKLATVLLTTDDDWISNTDRGIGILSVKASWLDGLLAGHEAEKRGVA